MCVASEFFSHLPVQFVLTVVAKDGDGKAGVQGLYAGDGTACFLEACKLSQKLNIQVTAAAHELQAAS